MNCNPHFNPANCGDDYGRLAATQDARSTDCGRGGEGSARDDGEGSARNDGEGSRGDDGDRRRNDDGDRRRDPGGDAAAPLETVALGEAGDGAAGDDDAPSRDSGAAGDAPTPSDDSMRNATPLMNRKLPVSGGAGWLSARAPAQHEAAGIHIHLAAHGGTAQIEIAGARLDGRRVGVSARLSRAELRELIRTLVMTRERWDAACGEGL